MEYRWENGSLARQADDNKKSVSANCYYEMKEDVGENYGNGWLWPEESLELVSAEPNLEDYLGCVAELDNGKRYYIVKSSFADGIKIKGINGNGELYYLDTNKAGIVKIYVPYYPSLDAPASRGDVILWQRPVKAVTMAEIEEKFGCRITIIDE